MHKDVLEQEIYNYKGMATKIGNQAGKAWLLYEEKSQKVNYIELQLNDLQHELNKALMAKVQQPWLELQLVRQQFIAKLTQKILEQELELNQQQTELVQAKQAFLKLKLKQKEIQNQVANKCELLSKLRVEIEDQNLMSLRYLTGRRR